MSSLMYRILDPLVGNWRKDNKHGRRTKAKSQVTSMAEKRKKERKKIN